MSRKTEWTRVKGILAEAFELDGNQRQRFLDVACQGEPDLRDKVEALLRADDRSSFLLADRPLMSLPATKVDRANEGVLRDIGCDNGTVGRYEIVRLIAEGGMGAVYLARQDGTGQEVALKLLRSALSSADARTRLIHEARVLGRLRHPRIARVFESGLIETRFGEQPFFAMEFVNGLSILDHARRNQLSIRDRLSLLHKIAEAVHHAHQRGIIHRDLKPANILVDELGEPKVLDFGIARLVEPEESDDRARTLTGQILGSVPFMSPEQCQGDTTSVDIRSDIFSLGVIAYELFAERHPFDVGRLPFPQATRAICEREAVPLGTVDRRYRGDVDVIVGKMLEKDRERRYQSAAELASDIERHLNYRPIAARPASVLYQLRRFARRKRAAVAGAAILVGVAGTLIATSWAMVLQRHEQELRAGAAAGARISAVLGETLRSLSPPASEQARIEMRAAVARGEAALAGEPAALAHFHQFAGNIHWADTVDHEAAVAHFEQALALTMELKGPRHKSTIRLANILGDVLRDAGRHDDARRLARQWYDRSLRRFGERHETTIRFAANLADALAGLEAWDEAEDWYRRTLAIQRERLAVDHPDVPEVMNSLARVLLARGKNGEALDLASEALARQRGISGGDRSGEFRALTTRGIANWRCGKMEAAREDLQLACRELTRVQGERHPDTLAACTMMQSASAD